LVIDVLISELQKIAQMLTADDIREELIRQLDTGALKGADVARYLRIAPARVTEMRKRERKVQQEEMQPLARLLNIDNKIPSFGGIRGVVPIPLFGRVAVGVWVEPAGQNAPISYVPYDVRSESEDVTSLFAVMVEGRAMSAEFAEGTILICRKTSGDDTWLPHDAFVVVEREANGLRELSCKQVERTASGSVILHNRSDDPRFAEPMPLGEGVTMIGRVVRAYKNYDTP
jgi:SOS-response transcriptional repressor LexA